MNSAVTVLQFGDGNFLRAFFDWMFEQMNQRCGCRERVMLVSPRCNAAACERVNVQQGKYHLIERGIAPDGSVTDRISAIHCVQGCLNPETDWAKLEEILRSPELKMIVSNTTEAGIFHAPGDASLPCPVTYPGMLTKLLHERFLKKLSGLLIFPCELIEKNGRTLREIVLKLASEARFGPEFARWVETENGFADTLVDRIVSGRPADLADLQKKFDFPDAIAVQAEVFHFLAFELEERFRDRLPPFEQAGLNVHCVPDLTPFRTRKVRLLNGTHTGIVMAGLLAGVTEVASALEDPDLGPFARKLIFDEILPCVPLPESEKRAFAEEVLRRFANPFAHHKLSSIALNSVSKWMVRDYPCFRDYRERFGVLPKALLFSLAALLEYYAAGRGEDSADVLEFFRKETATAQVLRSAFFPGLDDPEILEGVENLRRCIRLSGVRGALHSRGICE